MKKKFLEKIDGLVWATDLSSESKVCVPYIEFLNKKLKLNNHAVFVLPKISDWVYEKVFFATDDLHSEIKESRDRSYRKVAQYCEKKSLGAEVVVLEGIESEEIIRYTEETGADLILVGKRGISAINDLIIGSTTSRLIRNATVPVLVVTANKKAANIKKILCPIDFGEMSLSELNYSLNLSSMLNADLYTVHISEFFNYKVPVFTRDKLIESINERIQSIAKKSHYEIKDTIYDMGEPAEKIIETAEKGKFDLIVMAANQKAGAERLILGSITEKVLMNSKIPVLILPPFNYVQAKR